MTSFLKKLFILKLILYISFFYEANYLISNLELGKFKPKNIQ